MAVIHDDADRELATVVGILGVGGAGLGADFSTKGDATIKHVVTQTGVGAALDSEPFPALYVSSTGEDQTAEVQALIALSTTRRIVFGSGVFLLRPLSVIRNRIEFVGQGKSTTLRFVPNSDNEALFQLGDASPWGGMLIQSLRVDSLNTTLKKVAFRVGDISDLTIRDVEVGPLGTHWTGNGSVALEIKQRGESLISNVIFGTDIPIDIVAGGGLDHWRFEDCYLLSNFTTQPLIRVADDSALINVTFDGKQEWVGGSSGFSFISTASGAVRGPIAFNNVRWEQGAPGGYAIRVDVPAAAMRHVVLDNVSAGASKGFYFRGVSHVSLRDCDYSGASEALNCDGLSVGTVSIDSCTFKDGSTMSMTNMTRYRAEGDSAGTEPNHFSERWMYSSNANLGNANILRAPQVTNINVTDAAFSLNLAQWQTFMFTIANNGGVLQHGVIGDLAVSSASAYVGKITGASSTAANTPSVDSSTAFISGAGIDAAVTNRVLFNTAAQTSAKFGALCVVEQNSTGTAGVRAYARTASTNVNGVTLRRLAIVFTVDSTGAAFALTTANIPLGTTIQVRCIALLE